MKRHLRHQTNSVIRQQLHSIPKNMSTSVEGKSASEKTYSLAGKQLKLDSVKDIEPYTKEIEASAGLTKLDLSGNTLGIEASEALGKAILKHKDTLSEINFSDLYTGRLNTEIPHSLEHLLPALLKCSNLKTVNLSDNAFGLQTIDPIEEYLAKAVSIEHLILSNNGMGPFAGARIGQSLYKLAQAKKSSGKQSLKTFVCGRNRLENGSTDYLAIGLRNHEDLEVVRLYQNGIRPAGIMKLIKYGLSFNKHLQVLDLQDNTFTANASDALAESLSSWKDLREINVNDCLLKPKGSVSLLKELSEGPTRSSFTTLKLQYNELEADSFQYLVKAIKEKLPNLEVLELNGNRFEEEDENVKHISEIFEERGKGELDELDDLEEIDSEEEEEEEEEDETETLDEDTEANLTQLEKDLQSKGQEKDASVDDIAKELSKAHIN